MQAVEQVHSVSTEVGDTHRI